MSGENVRVFLCIILPALLTSFVDVSGQVGGGRPGLVVWEKISGNPRIWIAGIDGSNKRQLSRNDPGMAHQGAVISPDGRRVAYSRITDNGKEYPSGMRNAGNAIEAWVINTDGTNERKVFDNAYPAGENRHFRWLDAEHLAVGTAVGTFRVYIPETGEGSIKAGAMVGGRQTASNGLIVNKYDNRVILPVPCGTMGYHGDADRSWIVTIGTDYNATVLRTVGGCQAYLSFDKKYAVGAEYMAMDKSYGLLTGKSGVYDGSKTDNKYYDYFPTIGNDNTVGAIGKSSGGHNHRTSDYDIFVFNVSEQGGYLRPTGTIVNISKSRNCDRWPDVWVQTTPATPKVATTVISPSAGCAYPVQVSMTCATQGAEIRYTTNGSTPSSSSTLYSGPIAVNGPTTVKAAAFKTDMTQSNVAQAVFANARDAFTKLEAEKCDAFEGVRLTATAAEYIDNGDWIAFTCLNFGTTGAKSIDISIAAVNAGGTVEARADSSKGTLLGSLSIAATGGWTSYVTKTIGLNAPLAGTHDLYLVFKGGTGICNVDWIQPKADLAVTTTRPQLNRGNALQCATITYDIRGRIIKRNIMNAATPASGHMDAAGVYIIGTPDANGKMRYGNSVVRQD